MGGLEFYIHILSNREQMGNQLYPKPTTFKNLNLQSLKLKQTPSPSIHTPSSSTAKSQLATKIPQANKYPLYSFHSRKALPKEPTIYQLPSAISILTYNIWFENNNQQIRHECLLKMLQVSKCDFICLQEVTQQFVQLLHSLPADSWIQEYYTAVIPMGWYDTLILTKYKCNFYKLPFQNSFMSRNALLAEIVEAQGSNVVVGCMHYESLKGNQKIREEQIGIVQQLMKDCERVVIVGDYNFSDHHQENKAIDKAYTDLWVHLHKIQQDRYTMPQTTRFPSWRPDHILCKVPASINLNEAQIKKIGQFTIPPYEADSVTDIGRDDIVRTPSDHFGLISWVPLK